ncbi:MAG: cystathionine beta-synthase [Deltaproteobacteria bacterium]|nr:cystathionine beta-synthase [Deltaproteobacteria bacterium]
MRIFDNVLELIGRTPLVRLTRVTKGVNAAILAKVESLNPGGSVKDRIGFRMIDAAEREGRLGPDGTIIEPTSGNTGVGLAMAASLKGYRCIFVMPDKISEEKRALLRAYGAEIVVTPTAVTPDSPQHYVNVAKRLAQEIPGAYWPNQYNNPWNKQAHVETTGPEIWEDTEGTIDVLIGGMGTCGTMGGTAKFLKEQKPDLYVIGVDPEGSIFSGDTPHPYLVEGIGEDFLPRNLERGLIDEFIRISDRESFHWARRLAREEGLLVGGSAGTAMAAAMKYAMRLTAPKTIVVIFPDTGRNYLSKFYSDHWMQEHGMLDFQFRRVSVQEVLTQRHKDGVPSLIKVSRQDKVAEAVSLMHRYQISQIPVLEGAKNVGSLQEDTLMKLLYDGTDVSHQSVESIMGAPLPEIDCATDVTEAYRLLLAGANGILVLDARTPKAVISRMDLVDFWIKEKTR